MAVLLALFVGLRWFEYTQVYRPARNFRSAGEQPGHPFQDIYFTSGDGVKLNGWYYPANTNSPRKHWAVLVCHGNSGNISYLEELTGRLLQTGASVLLYDYRGYGKSGGRPSEQGTYRDALAAYQWLVHAGFAGTNILVYGQSLGGGMAGELALHEPLGGLVLESTSTSIPDVAAVLYPWLPVRLMGTIRYNTGSKLRHIKIPVLILHSRSDSLIPFEHAEHNYAAANEPKVLWEIRGEHAIGDDGCRAGLEKFLSAMETGQLKGSEIVNLPKKVLRKKAMGTRP
ncbi:MAG: alpha/beta hydrolase fold protein [Pedosphaera sp.]|nr:alpha/beta hydrolase fold protein [Pedosphaera sp.]